MTCSGSEKRQKIRKRQKLASEDDEDNRKTETDISWQAITVNLLLLAFFFLQRLVWVQRVTDASEEAAWFKAKGEKHLSKFTSEQISEKNWKYLPVWGHKLYQLKLLLSHEWPGLLYWSLSAELSTCEDTLSQLLSMRWSQVSLVCRKPSMMQCSKKIMWTFSEWENLSLPAWTE